MEINVIILAGGKGLRLWPLTHKETPKPLIKIQGKTLIEHTIDRYRALGRIFVMVPQDMVDLFKETIKDPTIEYIEETYPSGTALAMRQAADQFVGKEVLLFSPADQMITPQASLHLAIKKGYTAAKNGKIVSFGFAPKVASQHFGYICLDEEGHFDRFVEKPDQELAENLLAAKKSLCHVGIGMMRADTLISEWEEHYKPGDESFDYAVLNRTANIEPALVDCTFKDLGTFDALSEYMPFERNGKSLIHSSEMPVKIEGIDNLMVVVTKNGILIRKK